MDASDQPSLSRMTQRCLNVRSRELTKRISNYNLLY